MRRTLFLILAIFILATPAASSAAEEQLVGRVKKSIDDGVSFLKRMARNGTWEDQSPVRLLAPGGATALVVVALLNAGEDPDGKLMKAALEYLRTVEPNQTYVVGLQTMAFCLAKNKDDRPQIQSNLDWLASSCKPTGWSYKKEQNSTDHSINQYALLGIYEATRAGFKFDEKKLEMLHDYYNKVGNKGQYGYRSSRVPTLTMTTAGLCNLLITQRAGGLSRSVLDKLGRADYGETRTCGIYDENEQIRGALDYIADQYPGDLSAKTIEGSSFRHAFYCLYGIERAGRLTGQRFFGSKDWYRIGCRALVDVQNVDGSWGDHGSQRPRYGKVIETSFALLFLSKGRTPVLITKMAWGPHVMRGQIIKWNRKRDDLRNLTEYVSKELFDNSPLAWQVFDVRDMRVSNARADELTEELLASPITYLSGHVLSLGDAEKRILKNYVDNGGFIVAEACCGDKRFAKSFKAFVENEIGGSLTELDNSHEIWEAAGEKYRVKPGTFPLQGVKKGCKTIMIFNPGDAVMSGFWNKNLHEKDLGKEAFKMGANIVAYATGLEKPQPRLTTVALVRDRINDKPPRGYLQVVQLKLEGKGDDHPAPKAMAVLMTEMSKLKLEVATSKLDPRPTMEFADIANFRFFYAHGTGEFKFPPLPADAKRPEDDTLNDFRLALEDGGLLLADAACGAEGFDKQFRKLMKRLWPDKKLEPIELKPNQQKDELFSAEINGSLITASTLKYRRKGQDGKLSKKYQSGPPLLEGIKINGRWAVIYSPLDIGCALEKHNSTSCYGYDHESAKILGRAVVMYALRR